jgi:hypothetical protein
LCQDRTEGEGEVISKIGDLKYVETEMQDDLEEIAAKLLQAARKLPPGSERHGILKEIGTFRVRINRLRAQPDQLQTSK